MRAFAASEVHSLPMGRQVEGVRADGEHFPLEASVSQVEVDGRRLFTITLRDVSDRTRAEAALRASEERLRQAQKMEAVGQLAGGIAHDFNNLIAAILMNAELAAGEPGLPEDLRDELAAIAATAQRAANLTRQLLQFSRRELLQPRNLDLNQVATNAASLLRRLLREDVVLDLSLAPAPLFTHAEPTMLGRSWRWRTTRRRARRCSTRWPARAIALRAGAWPAYGLAASGSPAYPRRVVQDTSLAQALRHADLLRRMDPAQRARALRAVDRGVRRMALLRLRRRHPGASERELVIRLVAALHGVQTARRVYGQVPEDLAS